MENAKTKLSKGLKALLLATIFVAILFVGVYVALGFLVNQAGDPELTGIVDYLKYTVKGMLDLLLFRYAGGTNIAYFALSVFLYALFICWVIFFIAGIFINDRKNTRIMVPATILSFISFILYVVMASGSQKYWQIMNARGYYEGQTLLMILTLALVILLAIYFVLSILFYFWCIVHSYLAMKNAQDEEDAEVEPVKEVKEVKEMNDDDFEERVRRIMREELLANQPFQVYIVNDFAVQKEEPVPAPVVVEEKKEEPKPEPVKEEPKQVFPRVDFWKIAKEVWPQLDNPKPLPKEEKVVVAEAPKEEVTEEEADWNRSVRQPFINRIITADADIKANYNEIKNEILSYGVKSRLSRGGETFRLHEKRYVKIYLVGKTLKVYFALSPEDYKDSTIPVEDVGHRPNYADMPLLFKVRSGLSVRRCKELVKAACEKDGLTQGEVQDVNWINDLRKINAEKAKGKKGE